jgi:uncharacterized protein YegP (UPF0339 family)
MISRPSYNQEQQTMKRNYKVQFLSNKAGDFFWHVTAPNGSIVADSSEGYKRRAAAVRGFQNFTDAVKEGRVETLPTPKAKP